MNQNQRLPAHRLIPHRRRLLLIEWVKNPTDNSLKAETTVTAEWPLHRDGMVSSLICIELVAQTIAAFNTCRRGIEAGIKLGLLVGVKEVAFVKNTLPVGTRLSIQITKLSHVGEYAVFEGQVDSGSESFCRAVLQVLEPGDEKLANLKTRDGT
jgi:predicted hotdog family 3-hydroxylacyl-ACP dehydratase